MSVSNSEKFELVPSMGSGLGTATWEGHKAAGSFLVGASGKGPGFGFGLVICMVKTLAFLKQTQFLMGIFLSGLTV